MSFQKQATRGFKFIKFRHEGRSWYSPYRGRLWIHAGSTQKTEEEIKEVENFYKEYYAGEIMTENTLNLNRILMHL